jgi:hypothetical protein
LEAEWESFGKEEANFSGKVGVFQQNQQNPCHKYAEGTGLQPNAAVWRLKPARYSPVQPAHISE